MKFIDLFAGCGGLSLGLRQSGMEGVFAVERDAMAFRTFAANFLSPASKLPFQWPSWLQQESWAIDELLVTHQADLLSLRGRVQVIAGGPPCQGFSTAGRRNEADPRNQLFREYARMVDAVRPLGLILENVPGMKVPHACGLTCEVRRDRRQDARPGLVKMYPYHQTGPGGLPLGLASTEGLGSAFNV